MGNTRIYAGKIKKLDKYVLPVLFSINSIFMEYIMNIEIIKIGNVCIAELVSDRMEINRVQDALDLMANADYLGARSIIMREHHLTPDFFNLSTRFAGEILQKFTNYQVRLAIVGDFSKYKSKNFKDFIYESNKTGRILFLPDIESARDRIIK